MSPAQRARAELAAQALVCLALAALAAWVAPRLFVLLDEAYNLNVSVTLARHSLYATQLNGGFVLFDPQVTTGPVLLAPLALALRLGGVTLAVVRASMLAVFLLSLAAAGWGAFELVRNRWAALAFVVVLAMTPLVLEFGLCVLGDVPAIALAVAGFALLQRAGRSDSRPARWLLAAGLAFGGAVLCKESTLLILPALLATWLVQAALCVRSGRAIDWRCLWPTAIAATCTLAWQAIQQVAIARSLSPQAAADWNAAAGIARRRLWDTVSFAPLSHVGAAWQISAQYYVPLLLALAAALLGAIVVWRRQPARRSASPSYAWLALGTACAVWIGWFYLVSGPAATHRHLLPGLVLGQLVLVRAVWERGLMPRLLRGLLAACLVWSVLHGAGYLRLYLASSEPRLAMQQNAARYVTAYTEPDAALYGWGWYAPWHVAFLADRPVASLDPAAPQAATGGALFLLSPEMAWGGAGDARLQAFLPRHGEPVLAQRLYPVYRLDDDRP